MVLIHCLRTAHPSSGVSAATVGAKSERALSSPRGIGGVAAAAWRRRGRGTHQPRRRASQPAASPQPASPTESLHLHLDPSIRTRGVGAPHGARGGGTEGVARGGGRCGQLWGAVDALDFSIILISTP